jgi:hypothetical protein
MEAYSESTVPDSVTNLSMLRIWYTIVSLYALNNLCLHVILFHYNWYNIVAYLLTAEL